MSLREQISEDLKAAMKNGDRPRMDGLRFLLAAVKNAEIDKGRSLTDDELIQLLQKEAKKRKESVEEYQKAGRNDLADKELFELSLIEAYLPAQLSADEIRNEVEKVFQEVQPTSPKEMGKVMGILMKKLAGRADGKIVQQIVQERFKAIQ